MRKSRNVVPGKLAEAGFEWVMPTWEQAAPALVDRWRRGDLLAKTWITHISLDATAAGHGWFLDATPEDNKEFTAVDVTLVDARVSYRFKTVELFLDLKNLTDTEYEVRGFRNVSVTPGRPFTAFAGISLNL